MYENLDKIKKKIISSRKKAAEACLRNDKKNADLWEEKNRAYRAQYGLVWRGTLNDLPYSSRKETVAALARVDRIGRDFVRIVGANRGVSRGTVIVRVSPVIVP